METLVDPEVSKAKFEREISLYKAIERQYCTRGWFLVKAEFPEVFVVFACSKINPAAIILGVLLDFTNYDFWPPSVRFVNPFTRVPYKYAELPTKFERAVPHETPQGVAMMIQPLAQHAYLEDSLPFLCIPGIREYHENPAHTGDSWLQHRGKGEGTLIFILDQIAKYGVDPVAGYEFNIGMRMVRNSPPS
jgi:hypothetical protein